MIDRAALLSDLQALLKRLEADLLERSESTEIPDVGQTLRAEHERAKKAERTAQNYEDWRSDAITQAAAAWVLSCVFVRFLEDNKLIDPPKIAGTKERLQQARDEHTLYFQDSERAKLTDREYLLSVFDELAMLPGTRDVFGEHNPIRELPNWLSGDAAGELLRFFQKIDANTGDLIHDFTDPEWDTRFLGDLYQDLSEAARKKYALLQTPEFVEEFILDRTLDPALEEFGLDAPPITDRQDKPITKLGFRMIDPACGSGHFLLGAFPRILDRWQKQEPGGKIRDLVQKTLDCIHGVDVNPYAVAIARFRLLLMAIKDCGIKRLTKAPGFHFNLACGDSLLHTPLRGGQQVFDWELSSQDVECEHAYQTEDLTELKRMLRSGIYHAVVANPPYITPKDQILSQRYRKRYASCHMQYSLAAPFLERIFGLAVLRGFTGQITANSFMKREFGKKLIETFLPNVDLTHVIDTSGAYIPGHGTPTVILFGRNGNPDSSVIRTVMGNRGEPRAPKNPANGVVWMSIIEQIDNPDTHSDFISVVETPREVLSTHPWTLSGGGSADLKLVLDGFTNTTFGEFINHAGRTNSPGIDECYLTDSRSARRFGIARWCLPMVVGDCVRDWRLLDLPQVVYPYEKIAGLPLSDESYVVSRYLWHWRTLLRTRSVYGKSLSENGRPWFEHLEHYRDKLRTPLSLTWVEISTHNHFVFDEGGKLFKQTAPVLKLSDECDADDYLAFAGLLNSSLACFWLKQVCHNKGDATDQKGARTTGDPAFDTYDFKSTKIAHFPVVHERPLALANRLNSLAHQLAEAAPNHVVARWDSQLGTDAKQLRNLSQVLDEAYAASVRIRGEMVLLQEDLDWQCYRLYGLIDEDIIMGNQPADERRSILPGMRAFEVLLARKLAEGKAQTSWFTRHGITPRIELPDANVAPKYREVVERRIEVILKNPEIALVEQPEYKRRWYEDIWGNRKEEALSDWLLNRLESFFDCDGRMNDEGQPTSQLDIALTTVAKLADVARQDPKFMEVGEVYRDDSAFDVQRLVDELVQADNVPLLPVLRYKPAGLRKRQEWERTWELQRREDAIDARTQLPKDDPQHLTEDQAGDRKQQEIGDIPVPPKYKGSDFISTGGARYWSLRGKLDVPKERWVSFPHCDGPDGTLVIAWAGYDHLQLARAISAYFVDIQERLGGRDDPRLVPLLACIIELLPWLKQWHHDLDDEFQQHMDEVFEGFVTEEAKNLGLTIEEIKAWQPPKKAGRKQRT